MTISEFDMAVEALVKAGKIGYAIRGVEKCPDTGKVHLQGYLEVPKKKTLAGIKNLLEMPTIHLESRKGSQAQAVAYCRKDGEVVEWGVMMQQGQRSDLEAFRTMIDEGKSAIELAEHNFSTWCKYRRAFDAYRELKRCSDARKAPRAKPHVEVHWGAAGAGKSKHVAELIGDERADWVSATASGFVNGYTGAPVVVFDDFRQTDMEESTFLRLTDRYRTQVNVKGSSMLWTPKKIFFTSNTSPETWWTTSTGSPQVLRRLDVVTHWDGGSPVEAAEVEVVGSDPFTQ